MPMPMLPPAPPRLSTTTCWPQDSVILCATRRAMVSVAAPGANGTTMRIGRVGYCASAACAAAPGRNSAAASARLVVVFMFPSHHSSLRRDLGVLHDLRVARRLGLDEGRELLRRAGERLDARLHQALLEIGGVERLDQLRVQPADEIIRRTRGREDAV